MTAGAALDDDEITRSEIANSRGVQWYHQPTRSLIVPPIQRMAARFVNSANQAYIRAMARDELSDDETRCLLDYVKRKFAEERWPLSLDLRPVREALAKLDPKPKLEPPPPPKPHVPSLAAQRMRKKRR
jgi:hypothetical protein